ncbi:hypothetical protein [Caldimonas sp. KR1-144]|uniref:hypothetical protein n=1 Tax=Caldimonas sp. KR1-144 TaxID=3400911 RepID=UPI003C0F70D0
MKRQWILAVLSCVAMHGAALATSSQPMHMPVAELKRVYLHCDRLSARSVLDRGSAEFCSLVAEQLRLRGFDGSFERLIAWWQIARHVSTEVPTAQVGPIPGRPGRGAASADAP